MSTRERCKEDHMKLSENEEEEIMNDIQKIINKT